MRFRRGHWVTAALGLTAALATFDLQWARTLHYKLAQPDFYVYYLAARLGRAHGWASIYDPAVFLPPVTAAVGKPLPYLNPPELAWLVTPLSYLPYVPAGWIWTVLLAASFILVVLLVGPGRGASRLLHAVAAGALLPVFVGVLFGQVSLLVVAAVALAWWLLSRGRPWLAGIALAALMLKPQIAFLVPFAILLGGYWRMFLAWLGVTAPVAIATLLGTGTGVFQQIFKSMQLIRSVPGPIQSSLWRQLPPAAAIVAVGVVLGISALILWRSRGRGPTLPIAVGLLASVLVSPYINFYDLSAMVLAAWLILRLSPPRWQRVVTFGMYLPLYAAPISPLFTLACLCGWLVTWVPLAEGARFELAVALQPHGFSRAAP